MQIELSSTNLATYGDITATDTCKLARKIIASGVDPDTVIDIYRNGTKCFTDAPISHWAGLSASEGLHTSVKLSPYVPFPELR